MQYTTGFTNVLHGGVPAVYNSADYCAHHPYVEPVAGRPAAGRAQGQAQLVQVQQQARHYHVLSQQGRQHHGAGQAAFALR